MRLLVTGGSGFIGTNLIDEFKGRVDQLLNLDLHPPLDSAQNKFWREGDILDKKQLTRGVFGIPASLVDPPRRTRGLR